MKKLILFFWCLIFFQAAFASDNDGLTTEDKSIEKKQDNQNIEGAQASPNFPGSLRLGFGLSFLKDGTQDMGLGWWRSRSFDIHYFYDVPLGTSRFTFSPGIGLGVERFGFIREVKMAKTTEGTEIVSIDALNPSKSLLNANYVDIPLELKYHFGATPYVGFNIAIGGRIGYLIDAKTKVNYEQNGGLVKEKIKDDYNLNKLRYGVTARIGLGRFNLFYYQNLSPLFGNNGPGDKDMYHFKAGLSFAAF